MALCPNASWTRDGGVAVFYTFLDGGTPPVVYEIKASLGSKTWLMRGDAVRKLPDGCCGPLQSALIRHRYRMDND